MAIPAVLTLMLHKSLTGTSKKSCNDDMILFVFHVAAVLKSLNFQKKAGWPLDRSVRCRYKTFFSAPVRLCKDLFETARLIYAAVS